jgi:hypothetical protein
MDNLTREELEIYQLVLNDPGQIKRRYQRAWLSSMKIYADLDLDIFNSAFMALYTKKLLYQIDNSNGGTSSAHPSFYPYSPSDLVANKLNK